TLLQHLKELILHTDLKRDDCIFYYTTCGWMMWNWLVSSLAVGVKTVLYDGAPLAPTPTMLWDMVDQEGITVFGTSAKYLALLEKTGAEPRKTGYILYGRRDATLNPGGVRIGTAEIYRQVEQLPEVLESVAVGQEIDSGTPGDVRIVLFVKLQPGVTLDAALCEKISMRLR